MTCNPLLPYSERQVRHSCDMRSIASQIRDGRAMKDGRELNAIDVNYPRNMLRYELRVLRTVRIYRARRAAIRYLTDPVVQQAMTVIKIVKDAITNGPSTPSLSDTARMLFGLED